MPLESVPDLQLRVALAVMERLPELVEDKRVRTRTSYKELGLRVGVYSKSTMVRYLNNDMRIPLPIACRLCRWLLSNEDTDI